MNHLKQKTVITIFNNELDNFMNEVHRIYPEIASNKETQATWLQTKTAILLDSQITIDYLYELFVEMETHINDKNDTFFRDYPASEYDSITMLLATIWDKLTEQQRNGMWQTMRRLCRISKCWKDNINGSA